MKIKDEKNGTYTFIDQSKKKCVIHLSSSVDTIAFWFGLKESSTTSILVKEYRSLELVEYLNEFVELGTLNGENNKQVIFSQYLGKKSYLKIVGDNLEIGIKKDMSMTFSKEDCTQLSEVIETYTF